MKAPVGLSSGRTFLREQDGGALPRQVPRVWLFCFFTKISFFLCSGYSCGAGLYGFYKMHCRRIRSLLRAKREPERTAVPAGHESPSGAFKPQTGLRSKCCVFSTARSQRFQRAGSMKRGYSLLLDPKAVRLHTKNPSRFARGFFVFRRFRVAYATSCTGKFVLYLLRG